MQSVEGAVAGFFTRNSKSTYHAGQIGISFSPDELAFAHIVNSHEGSQLYHYGHIKGHDTQQRQFLKDKVSQLNLQGMPAKVLLPERDYQVFLIERPQVPDEEKKDAIRWQITEYIDFPIEQAVVDFIELPQKANSESAPMLYVIVSTKNKIDETISWVTASGLKVKSIDIYQSALRHIAMHLENAEEGQALLHLEEEKSHLILFKEKTLYMMRDLDLGLNILKSLPQEETVEHISMYQDLSLEIQRSFDYCASNLQNANISRLVLTPLSEKRPHLLSNLSNILGLPVREIHYSEFLHLNEELTQSKEGISTFAIGAALEY